MHLAENNQYNYKEIFVYPKVKYDARTETTDKLSTDECSPVGENKDIKPEVLLEKRLRGKKYPTYNNINRSLISERMCECIKDE